MDYVRSLTNQRASLSSLCQCSDNESSTAKASIIPDSRFDEIAKTLEADVQKPEWSSRPRTYFILWQIKRIDAMESFIAQGLNDTSLPYKSRSSLPATLDVGEAVEFLRWQDTVISDILSLEQGPSGKHLRITDGDTLFERRPKKLGVGSQGSTIVDKVVSKSTGKVYARKRINRKQLFGYDSKAQKVYENELKTLRKVADHEHLVKVRGTYTDKKWMVMLLQPVADENLRQFMDRQNQLSVDDQARFRTYFGCLAHTMKFLHDEGIGILHKDIKPENILLKSGHLFLTDFGTAFDWSETGQSMTQSNARDSRTPRYQSPEAALGRFHRSSDIWSLGVVYLEMVTFLRGKNLSEMDAFLQKHGGHTHVHLNIEGAMKWFEELQAHACDFGSPIDNEPLTWVKSMLNREHTNRPSAAELSEDVSDFQDGRFCGNCCLESDSSCDESFESDRDMLSDIVEEDEKITPFSSQDQQEEEEYVDCRDEPPMGESMIEVDNAPRSQSPSYRKTVHIQADGQHEVTEGFSKDDTRTTRRHGSISSQRENDVPLTTSKHSRHDASRSPSRTSKSTKEVKVFVSHKTNSKTKSKPFRERDTFIQWLASLPEKFAPRQPINRSSSSKNSDSSKAKAPTVETQRIRHFLYTLPEEITEFDYAPDGFAGLEGSIPPLRNTSRSRAMPISSLDLKRSNSQEDLRSTSHLLYEEDEKDQFADVARSRLVHYASDGDIKMTLTSSKEGLQAAKSDLASFAASLQLPSTESSPTAPEPAAAAELENRLPPETSKDEAAAVSSTVVGAAGPSDFIAPSEGTSALDAHPDHVNDHKVSTTSKDKEGAPNHRTEHTPSNKADPPKAVTSSEAPRLGSFIGTAPLRKRRRFESATEIIGRILDDKSSEAPTSVMSANTRAIVSKDRIGLRWNDKAYGYLPKFVADGKVGAVRECLNAGCNPGTIAKPRWAPVYNAVRGGTDKHLKCLRALTKHGADVNARRSTNRRTPLHYAVESAPWQGYSSIIYTLLVAGANPNVRDKANDLPLLMLLVGSGPLSQMKRDALFLLLAPNFATDLNVRVSGTLDNPLHLAIRRKDAYTVDAILEKMSQIGGSALDLLHERNASGFTPLLLAMTIFPLGENSDEELQIIEYLLKHGSNPNDIDATQGKTPLHLVIGVSKNTIALELLCRRFANSDLCDVSGQSPKNLVKKLRAEYPADAWYAFADQRMRNGLTPEHYRPPELLAFLAEEAEASRVPAAKL